MSLHVHLQQFEGPLGLLLYLIRKEEMDIFDINIQQITGQYLEYIRRMKSFDLEVAGDFIAMAATLLQIKSQMLLPKYNDQGEEVEEEDPRTHLVQKLLEYQRFQDASKKIYSRPLLYRDQWPRGQKEIFASSEEPEILLDEGGLFSMISLYRKALRRIKTTTHDVGANTQSIASRVMELRAYLKVGLRIAMSSLFRKDEPLARRREVLITFLSLLELAKMGFVSLFQSENFKDIHIQTQREIGSDVAAHVHEYDSQGSEHIAGQIMQEAEIEGLKVARDLQSALEVQEELVATDEDIDEAEAEVASAVESHGGGSDVVA